MTRLLTMTAAAALFATAASAQMSPNFEPSAENCKKPQYSTTDACKNFLEGRSATESNKPADTVGSSKGPGSGGNGSGSGGSSPGGGSGSSSQ